MILINIAYFIFIKSIDKKVISIKNIFNNFNIWF